MSYPFLFDKETTASLVRRIQSLKPGQKAHWGKMNVAKMLSHCAVPYEHLAHEKEYDVPFLMKLIARIFFKKSMTNEVDYTRNLPTAPSFVIREEKDFEKERDRLISYINIWHGKPPHEMETIRHGFLGKLTAKEWSNLLYKHLDLHLRQFGV